MPVRYFALISGIFFLIAGLAGFLIPAFVTPLPPTAPGLVVEVGYGKLFGLFPVNVLHNLVHLGIGIWGLAAYSSFRSSRLYCQGTAIFYGLLAVMGFIPLLSTTFGLIPIWGHDIWLHGVTAGVAAYFGFVWQEHRRTAYA